jgi:hypothetical protein
MTLYNSLCIAQLLEAVATQPFRIGVMRVTYIIVPRSKLSRISAVYYKRSVQLDQNNVNRLTLL